MWLTYTVEQAAWGSGKYTYYVHVLIHNAYMYIYIYIYRTASSQQISLIGIAHEMNYGS